MLYAGLSRDPNQNIDDKGRAWDYYICMYASPYNIMSYKCILQCDVGIRAQYLSQEFDLLGDGHLHTASTAAETI